MFSCGGGGRSPEPGGWGPGHCALRSGQVIGVPMPHPVVVGVPAGVTGGGGAGDVEQTVAPVLPALLSVVRPAPAPPVVLTDCLNTPIG